MKRKERREERREKREEREREREALLYESPARKPG